MIKFNADQLKRAQQILAESGIALAPEPPKDEAAKPMPPEKPVEVAHDELWAASPNAADEPPAGTAAEAPKNAAVELILNQCFSYNDSPRFDFAQKRELREKTHKLPNAARYAESLKSLIDTHGLLAVKEMATKMREGAQATLERLGIPISPYGESISWAMWDIGKQEDYVLYPPVLPDPNYEVKSVFNSDTPNTKFYEVIDRHIGWETYNAYREGAPCFRDATIWERIHPQNRAAIEELLSHPPKGHGEPGEGTLPAHELAKLGALLREEPPIEVSPEDELEVEAPDADDAARLEALRRELEGISKEDKEADEEKDQVLAESPRTLIDAKVSRMVDGVEMTFERGKEYVVADEAASAAMEGARVVRITSFVELRPSPAESPEVFASVVDLAKSEPSIRPIPTIPAAAETSESIARSSVWYVGLESLRSFEQFATESELNAAMEAEYGLKPGDEVYPISYYSGGKVGDMSREILRFHKEEGTSPRVVLSAETPGGPEAKELPYFLAKAEVVERLEPRIVNLTIDDVFTRFDQGERIKILENLNYHRIAAAVMQLSPEEKNRKRHWKMSTRMQEWE